MDDYQNYMDKDGHNIESSDMVQFTNHMGSINVQNLKTVPLNKALFHEAVDNPPPLVPVPSSTTMSLPTSPIHLNPIYPTPIQYHIPEPVYYQPAGKHLPPVKFKASAPISVNSTKLPSYHPTKYVER